MKKVLVSAVFAASALLACEKLSAGEIEVIADGRGLVYTGEVVAGDAQKLRKAVLSNPKVTAVVLHSDGGLAAEGVRMGYIVHAHDLHTIAKRCLSACAFIWTAGNNRTILSEGVVAQHSVSTQEDMTRAELQAHMNFWGANMYMYYHNLGYSANMSGNLADISTTGDPTKWVNLSFLRNDP